MSTMNKNYVTFLGSVNDDLMREIDNGASFADVLNRLGAIRSTWQEQLEAKASF
ncbi:MAG: hypothetical protein HYS07_06915 [Chlamydiae bacterium]|nr:hypothetical protein [Chlamydiota bacterium]MBI3277513.1 hypothetical protein [Chlamydiota bacterium]